MNIPFRSGNAKRRWSILYWLPTGLVVSQYFYNVNYISGRSMQPTLNPDSSLWRDVALFNRYSIHDSRRLERDDIVSLRSPMKPTHMLVKRIVAKEGDIVTTLPPYPDREVRVPEGHVWIEGDEPFNSDDSNLFGPVPIALLESKLVLILWPFNRFGRLTKPQIPSVRSGPAYRHAVAKFERERARHSRVQIKT